MINPEILFGPLVNIQLGAPMYLTDLEYIYEYTVTYKEYVAPTRVDLLDIVPDKTLLTLITAIILELIALPCKGNLPKRHLSKKLHRNRRCLWLVNQSLKRSVPSMERFFYFTHFPIHLTRRFVALSKS